MNAFRADIEGLRAIAVLAVLAYHVVPWVVPGGYVGVDVFFVISGFLITRSIVGELSADRFQVMGFYARRIRRLLPAVAAMLAVCAGVVLATGLPHEIREFGESTVATALYVANHYFLSHSGYFDEALGLNPLLHTWSLSVEEQFYLVYPFLLILVVRWTERRRLIALAALALASFALSVWLVHIHPAAAYFVAPSRFWQFLAGAVIALKPVRGVSPAGATMAGVVGLGLLAVSILLFTGDTPFPGLAALPPTLGTALIIAYGSQPHLPVSRLLAFPVLRFLGKISYSLYLWHWPIIVFYRLQINPDPSALERYLLMAASVVAGYLSWRFVEMPFLRKRSATRLIARPLWAGGMATLVLVASGLALAITEGGRDRLTTERLGYVAYLDYDADAYFRADTCFLTSETNDSALFEESRCLQLDSARSNVLIVGDSHAAQYYHALATSFPSVSISQVNASGCRPLVNYDGAARCVDLIRRAFEQFVPDLAFDAIVLAGRWERGDMPALVETIRMLDRYTDQVIVLGPIIEYQQALPRLLARYGRNDEAIRHAAFYDQIRALDRRMATLLAGEPAVYYSIVETVCPDAVCRVVTDDGTPMQFDGSHLTDEGARFVVHGLISRGFLQQLTPPKHLEARMDD